MNKLLSQDEVDALLKGLDTGDIEAEQKPGGIETAMVTLDWASQGINIRTTMPLLEVVFSRFTQKLRSTLSSALRKLVDINSDPIESIKYSEFQRSLPVPTSMHLFKLEPLRGMGILVIESRLVFSLVEAFFGGNGKGSTKIEGRDFTPIEKRIIEKVVQMALNDFTTVWEDVHAIKTEFVRSESNPLVVNIVPGEEIMMLVKIEVELNKPLGTITLCIPVSCFQPIKQKLAGGYRVEEAQIDLAWVNSLRDRILETEVEMAVDLGHTYLSIKDLLKLKAGDILILDNHFKKPLPARIDGIAKFEGFVGSYHKKKVFKVENSVAV